jgi:hypothetical protein
LALNSGFSSIASMTWARCRRAGRPGARSGQAPNLCLFRSGHRAKLESVWHRCFSENVGREGGFHAPVEKRSHLARRPLKGCWLNALFEGAVRCATRIASHVGS